MDEQNKPHLMAGALALSVTVTLFQIVFNSGLFGFDFSYVKLLLAIVVGLLAGGGAFYVSYLKSQ